MSLSDPELWRSIFGGLSSDAGISVSPDSSLKFSPVWQAVTAISGDVSTIPTFVYKRLAGGGKQRAKAHPAYRLLRRKANPLHTATQWKQIAIAQACLYGNHYSVINRDQFAKPLELLPLNPEATHATNYRGRAMYRSEVAGVEKLYDPVDVFHIAGLTIEGIDGLNLIQYATNSLGKGLAAEKYGAKFFSNNTVPTGILTHPHRLKDTAIRQLRESMKAIHGGLDNQHRVAILEEGMQWTQLGIDPEKAQLVATLDFSIKDVARWFNIPSHRLGDNTKTSYSSLEQENLSYQQSTLGPWFCKLREQAYDKLLTERQKERDSHTVEELRLAILLADAATRANFYSRGLLDGWLSRDEVREYENLNPIPDGMGKQFMVPLNMQILGQEPPEDDDEPEDDPPAADPDDDEDEQDEDDGEQESDRMEGPGSIQRALAVGLLDATERAAKRLAHYTQRASKDGGKFCQLIDTLEKDHQDVIARMYRPVLWQAAVLGVDLAGERGHVLGLAGLLIDTWREDLERLAQETNADELHTRAEQRVAQLTGPEWTRQFLRDATEWNAEQFLALSS